MNHLLKSLAFVGTLTVCYADQAPAITQYPSQEQMDPNPTARWGTNSKSNFYLTGEVVWFRPLISNYGFANLITGPEFSNTNRRIKSTYLQYNFEPGFRVSAAYNTGFDGWDLQLIYTRLDYKQTNIQSFTNLDARLIPSSNSNNTQGQSTYKLDYNLGDLDLGRLYKVSERFKVRPHVGVRALWYKAQSTFPRIGITLNTSGGIIYNTTVQSKTYPLVGLEGGCEGYWGLSDDFSLYGNITLSSLIRSSKYRDSDSTTYTANSGYSISANKTNKSTSIVFNMDFSLGVRWDKSIHNDDYHFALNVGYEQHSYRNIDVASAVYQSTGNNDLNLQGIAAGARLDF